MPKRNEEVPVQQENEIRARPVRIGLMGPVGAGKTTLAGILGENWGVVPVEENFGENPYLKDFYESPKQFSFKSQTWFLVQKINQLTQLESGLIEIIDPADEMDFLFAQVHFKMEWMNDPEWDLYKSLYDTYVTAMNIRPPDIYVSVNAPLDTLKQRIKERGREFELKMLEEKPEYFEMLSLAVSDWARNIGDNSRVLEVNSNGIDYSGNKNSRDSVVKYIENGIRVYFQGIEGKGVDGNELILPEVLRKD